VTGILEALEAIGAAERHLAHLRQRLQVNIDELIGAPEDGMITIHVRRNFDECTYHAALRDAVASRFRRPIDRAEAELANARRRFAELEAAEETEDMQQGRAA